MCFDSGASLGARAKAACASPKRRSRAWAWPRRSKAAADCGWARVAATSSSGVAARAGTAAAAPEQPEAAGEAVADLDDGGAVDTAVEVRIGDEASRYVQAVGDVVLETELEQSLTGHVADGDGVLIQIAQPASADRRQ